MATIPKEELDQLKSALAQLTDAVTVQTDASRAAADASKAAAAADNQEAAASKAAAQGSIKGVVNGLFNVGNAAIGTVNAMYGLAKVIAGIGEDGRKFAEKVGTTATKGAQFQMDINKMLLSEVKKFGADQAVIIEQIRGTYTSFADVFGGATEGMQVSARGVADFSRSLNKGFKTEFTLTSQAMRGLITVGISTTKQFDAFRRASGLAGVSTSTFSNLVNKNALSFMLYGPSFARAARDAERLGISLVNVQKAQEALVTNLDGAIDTVAQLNQVGAGIDFGTLITLAETQGPEATLKYLQSTIPPNLFQSASTRALISKLGIPLEDLMKRTGSVQESAANKIEDALTQIEQPASRAAVSLAELNKKVKNIDNSRLMEIMNASVGVVNSLKALAVALYAFTVEVGLLTLRMLGMNRVPRVPSALPGRGVPPAVPSTPFGGTAFKGTAFTLSDEAVAMGMKLPPTPAPTASPGFFSRLLTGARTTAITSPITKMGAAGVGASVLSAGLGTFEGYSRGRENFLTKTESAGMGAAQGGTALIGAILGGFGGPFGVALGGFIGNWLGKKMNEWFPEFGLMIGDSFSKLFEPFKDLKNSFKGLFDASIGLGPVIKAIAAVLGGALATTFDILSSVISGAISALSGIIKLMSLDFKGAISSFRNAIANMLSAFEFIPGMKSIVAAIRGTPPPTTAPVVEGGDTIASPGYGSRTLVTPNGSVALNDRDTVIAYADDMISGIKTYSLGTFARGAQSTNNNLNAKVEELVSLLRDAKTTVQIDNKIQEVPRIALAGVYTRNERV